MPSFMKSSFLFYYIIYDYLIGKRERKGEKNGRRREGEKGGEKERMEEKG